MDSSEGKPPTTLERQNMTTFTPEQKAEVKKEAKDLGINVVGKSIERLQALILEKKPKQAEPAKKTADPKMVHLRALAKELGIAFGKTTPYADLRFAVADQKGWANESTEVIEFLIAGGSIEELPGFTGIAPKANSRETSAGGKVEAKEPKAPRTPRKISKAKAENGDSSTNQVKDGSQVTLQSICDELGVEGRVARRKLRGSEIAKPGDSWTWYADHSDIQLVRELLKK